MNNSSNKYIEPFIYDATEQFISTKLTKMQLSDLRKSKHLTQKDIAILSKLSIQCVSNIEGKSGNPTLASLIKYLDALGFEICFKKKSI